MTDQDMSAKIFQEEFQKIPKDAQYAIAWIVKYINFVDQMVEEPIDQQVWAELMKKAVETNDTLFRALLLYYKYYHKDNSGE